jgi:hypothetical protein
MVRTVYATEYRRVVRAEIDALTCFRRSRSPRRSSRALPRLLRRLVRHSTLGQPFYRLSITTREVIKELKRRMEEQIDSL